MVRFEFATGTEIIFGTGRFAELPDLCLRYGPRVLVINGLAPSVRPDLVESFKENLKWKSPEASVEVFHVHAEPEIELVDSAARLAMAQRFDCIVGLGGGSALDTAKAVSALVTNGGPLGDYLEGVGTGKQVIKPALPLIAVPTTAGTGSEVTENAVISSKAQRFKKSIRSRHLRPRVALIDPQLTVSCPPHVTASCGLDALAQLIEPYLSKSAQPITDALALVGMRLTGRWLVRAYENGGDIEARQAMSLASLYGGICLANARLGAVHGIAAALGALHDVGHGTACALLLTHVMRANLKVAREAGLLALLEKFSAIAECLAGDERAEAGIEFVAGLCSKMNIPCLKEFRVTHDDIPDIIRNSRGSSMKFNPVELSDVAIGQVLEAAMEGPHG